MCENGLAVIGNAVNWRALFLRSIEANQFIHLFIFNRASWLTSHTLKKTKVHLHNRNTSFNNAVTLISTLQYQETCHL